MTKDSLKMLSNNLTKILDYGGCSVDVFMIDIAVNLAVFHYFDFEDFEMKSRSELLEMFPKHREVMEMCTYQHFNDKLPEITPLRVKLSGSSDKD